MKAAALQWGRVEGRGCSEQGGKKNKMKCVLNRGISYRVRTGIDQIILQKVPLILW